MSAWKPLSQARPGDVLEHPGYGFAPFTVREVDDHGDYVLLRGTVVDYPGAGPVEWRIPRGRAADGVERHDPNMRLHLPDRPGRRVQAAQLSLF